MKNSTSCGTNDTNGTSEEKMLTQDTNSTIRNGQEFLAQEKPTRKALKIVGKVIEVLLGALLCYLLIISTPILLGFISTMLQEESASSLMSISVVASFCLAFAIISLSVKRCQNLPPTATPQLSRRFIIYSIVCAVALAMLTTAVVVVAILIAQIANCEGSSCAAAIIVSFAFYPVISFAALSVISIAKIIKINRHIAHQRQN